MEKGARIGLIDFVVDISTPGGKMVLKHEGEIVPVETATTSIGVAVKSADS